MRSGGAPRVLPFFKAWKDRSGGAKRERIRWAVKTMTTLAKGKNTPALESDLGEILAADPAHHERARRLLSSLSKRDLLTSRRGYEQLVALRQARAADKPSWLRAPIETL